MSKSVLFSIKKQHTTNIKSGAKTVELRTRPPKIDGVYKAYIYETCANGGCGKVIGEFDAYNEGPYRICMGIPAHLMIEGCVTADDIMHYTDNGNKDIYAISISDLIIYDKPKELNEFKGRKLVWRGNNHIHAYEELTKPPQSWCYVDGFVERCM